MQKNKSYIFKLLGVLFFIVIINEAACRFVLPLLKNSTTVIKPFRNSFEQHRARKLFAAHQGTPTGRMLSFNRIVTSKHHPLSKKKVVVETSSIGYRNREVADKAGGPGYQRILFMGDSIVAQNFLNEEETFVRLIEKYAHEDKKSWETINAGADAAGLKTELSIFLETGLELKPDVVVLNFYLNDFQESDETSDFQFPKWLSHSKFLTLVATMASTKIASFKKSRQQEEEEIILNAWRADFEKNHKLGRGNFNDSPEAFNTLIVDNFRKFGSAWRPEEWSNSRSLFMELKRLSVENNFKLIIVSHPSYYQVYTEFVNDYPQQQLKQLANDLDVPVLDLLPPLRAEALRRGGPSIYHGMKRHHEIFYDECHHTEAGSVFIADQIYSFLSDNL